MEVLIADLDHFKRVNNTYSHPVGDLVLREAARRLRDTARHYDHVGRIGGEEFLRVKHKGRNGVDIIPHPHSVVAKQMKKAG